MFTRVLCRDKAQSRIDVGQHGADDDRKSRAMGHLDAEGPRQLLRLFVLRHGEEVDQVQGLLRR